MQLIQLQMTDCTNSRRGGPGPQAHTPTGWCSSCPLLITFHPVITSRGFGAGLRYSHISLSIKGFILGRGQCLCDIRGQRFLTLLPLVNYYHPLSGRSTSYYAAINSVSCSITSQLTDMISLKLGFCCMLNTLFISIRPERSRDWPSGVVRAVSLCTLTGA